MPTKKNCSNPFNTLPELPSREVAVVGMGPPQVACVLARHTHAPGLSLLLEIGVADTEPVDTPVGLADSRIFYNPLIISNV